MWTFICGYSGTWGWKAPFFFMTTVHKDMVDRLVQINPELAGEVRRVLDVNKQERHIRGGLATKEKYLHKSSKMFY